jgi:diguanylate cyclase (GGDEF)-like protein
MSMRKYGGDLSDRERRKLYRDFTRAAKEIKVDSSGAAQGAASGGEAVKTAPVEVKESWLQGEQEAERFLFHGRRRKRPSYRIRLKIESYAYSQGFEISGIRQFFSSVFSFLWPKRDPVSWGFLRSLVLDSAHRGDPEGYSLLRTVTELQRMSENLLKGGGYLRRNSDSSYNVRGDLTRDLLNWEPAVYRLLTVFEKPPPRLLEALEAVRIRFERQKSVDTFELIDVVKGVYRITVGVQADPEVLEERLFGAGELIKGLYKRIYTSEDRIQQVCARIDHRIADFLAAYTRLKYFAAQLYPALLKMMNLFRPQEEVGGILANIYSFIGLEAKSVLVLRRSEELARAGGSPKPESLPPISEPEQEAVQMPQEQEEPDYDFNEEFRGILTILDYAFPGCRAQYLWEGDYSMLLWFHQKIFLHRDYRGPLLSRKPDFMDLLWKISRRDPLAPVIVLHELIGQMLESLNPAVLMELMDPLRVRRPRSADAFAEIRRQWRAVRDEPFLRYLKEVDYFEKEMSLRGQEVQGRFLISSVARKTIETVNQIRSHVIRDFGHVALNMDRREYFRCRPLYSLVGELYELLGELAIRRDQLDGGNPIVLQRFDRKDLVAPQPGPLMNQIHSYIEALPDSRRILKNRRAEYNRVFLEILLGLTELLDFLLNDPRSRLREAGAGIHVAASEEQSIRNEIDNDQTPLRIDLKKDFEETDRLTGLVAKNEYLRFMPSLFRSSRQSGQPLSLMVIDLDHFKAINDTRGHDFGDEILKLAAEVILSSGRGEDPAVRFGGDELLVIVKAEVTAALLQAERIRGRYLELLRERYERQLQEIPRLMAGKELAEKLKADRGYRGGVEDFLERWKGRWLGTLSIGVAQGLGKGLSNPCADEKQLFRRADKILYLAKDFGGNQSVAMFDILEIPLTAAEHIDFAEYLEQIPASERALAAKRFVDLRLAGNQAPVFWNYPYQKYLEDA